MLTQSEALSSVRAAGIRLAGATSDVHIMDVRSGKWEKMAPQGEPPSPRAAHAAAAVGSMVVVQVCSIAGLLLMALVQTPGVLVTCMMWQSGVRG